MSPAGSPTDERRRGGLFGRILLTFVATALASALVAWVAGFMFANRFSAGWIADVEEAIETQSPALQAARHDDEEMARLVKDMGQQLDAHVGVYRRRGQRVLGDGPRHLPPPLAHRRRDLRRGTPVVLRTKRFEPPMVLYGIPNPDNGKFAGILAVTARTRMRMLVPLLSLGLMLPVLGIGAWVLSRSLTRRLARIEASANRIARGELRHRIALDVEIPRDELDQLATAFNEMAQKVEALLQGQRTLLANVSHELRTPIARMKVLVEILQERVLMLRDRGDDSRPVQRLDKGLADMAADIGEVESLISDLLTSGRLELRHGAGGGVVASRFDVGVMLARVADKVGARVDLEGEPVLEADELLVERLLSNLLANARRACPDKELSIEAACEDSMLVIRVQDEGPGVAPGDRESIFEPFTRLDDARDRDRGGVGLGLYLCRQICSSHGGSIEVTDRPDGAPGACFVVRLPLERPAAA